MTSRERVFAALSGDWPDRPPVALGFRPTPVERYAPNGNASDYAGPLPDIVSVGFEISDAETRFRKAVSTGRYDTRLGTPDLVMNYDRWQYHANEGPRNPLAAATGPEQIQAFAFPDQEEPSRHAHLRAHVSKWREAGYAVAGGLPHLGGELFETGWRLRGLEAWLLDLVERPEMANALLDQLQAMCLANVRLLASAGVDILVLDDDVGMPTGMLIHPNMWRTYLKPRVRRIIDAAREVRPEMFVLYHSDGHVLPIVEDLVEIGVDALNPIQPDVVCPESVKKEYGNRITLWGGIGTQATFSDAAAEDVIDETRIRLATLGPDRYVACPAYDLVEGERLWENVKAFLQTACG